MNQPPNGMQRNTSFPSNGIRSSSPKPQPPVTAAPSNSMNRPHSACSIPSTSMPLQELNMHIGPAHAKMWRPPVSIVSNGMAHSSSSSSVGLPPSRPNSSGVTRRQTVSSTTSSMWTSANIFLDDDTGDEHPVVHVPNVSISHARRKGHESPLLGSRSSPVLKSQEFSLDYRTSSPNHSIYDGPTDPIHNSNVFRGYSTKKTNRISNSPPKQIDGPSASKNYYPKGGSKKKPDSNSHNSKSLFDGFKARDIEYTKYQERESKKAASQDGISPKNIIDEVMKEDTNLFDEDFVDNLETFSAPLRKAVILELLGQLRHRNSLLSTIKSINAELNHETAMRRVVNEACDFLNADRACLFWIDDKRQQIVSKVLSVRNSQDEIRFEIGRGIAGYVAQTGQFLNIPDAHENALFNPAFDQKTGYRTRGILCMCIRDIQGRKCAVMQVINKMTGNGAFSEEDQKDMEIFAVQAGNSLRNGLLYDAAVKVQHKISVLLDVSKQLASELDLTALCKIIMMKAKELLGADRCTLFLVDEKTKELWSKVADGSSEIRFPMTVGIAGHVASTGETLNIPDAYLDPRFNPDVDRKSGYKTKGILCMPIKNARGNIIGVTQMINKLDNSFFDEDDEQLLFAFSSQASVSLENSKLFQSTTDMRNFLESILKSITNLVLVLDMSGLMLTANRPTIPFLGLDEEHLKKSTFETWLGTKNQVLMQDIKDAFRSTQPKSMTDYEYHVPHDSGGDGPIKTMNYTVVALTDSELKQTGVVLVLEDVSPQKKLQTTLGRYMSPALADEVLKHDSRLQLGGKHLKVATLFCDIRKFTSISEKMDAGEVVDLLNDYFSHMVSAVFAEKGILDKYIGDALMAVFGVPMTAEDDSYRACRAALQMISNLSIFNQKRRQQGLDEINIGIGINTGRVLSGNIGTERRLEYTVIGDGVNLASRVEGATKQYGVSTMITEFTEHEVAGRFVLRELDYIRVVGKTQPIRVYELIREVGTKPSADGIDSAISHFARGLQLYRQRLFEDAVHVFQEADRSREGGDLPSQVFVDRCKRLSLDPPGHDWDGVWSMDSKFAIVPLVSCQAQSENAVLLRLFQTRLLISWCKGIREDPRREYTASMATKEMCVFCFDVLQAHLTKAALPEPTFENGSYPLFVTWQKVTRSGEKDLRGCIGTFSHQLIHSGLADYAITSAVKDRRFQPITMSEVPSLSCSVSLLTNFEPAGVYEWDVGIHGIIIKINIGGGYNATFLPEVCSEQGWTKQECLEHLIRKSGFRDPITPKVISSITLERYQSSKASLDFAEYKQMKGI